MNAPLLRTRIAVLWVAAAVAASSSVILYLVMPGALEEMLAGEMEGEPLDDTVGYLLAMLVVIPVAMAATTLLSTDRVSCYANLIAGVLFGLFGTFAVASHVLAGEFDGHVLLAALTCFLVFVIVGLSVAGLRRPGPSAPAPTAEPGQPHVAAAPTDRHLSG